MFLHPGGLRHPHRGPPHSCRKRRPREGGAVGEAVGGTECEHMRCVPVHDAQKPELAPVQQLCEHLFDSLPGGWDHHTVTTGTVALLITPTPTQVGPVWLWGGMRRRLEQVSYHEREQCLLLLLLLVVFVFFALFELLHQPPSRPTPGVQIREWVPGSIFHHGLRVPLPFQRRSNPGAILSGISTLIHAIVTLIHASSTLIQAILTLIHAIFTPNPARSTRPHERASQYDDPGHYGDRIPLVRRGGGIWVPIPPTPPLSTVKHGLTLLTRTPPRQVSGIPGEIMRQCPEELRPPQQPHHRRAVRPRGLPSAVLPPAHPPSEGLIPQAHLGREEGV